jgi:hypothetical protein
MARFMFDLQLFASGAGMNRASVIALSIQDPTNIAVVAAPTTAYGIIGANDSGQLLTEARDFTKWTVTKIGAGTGYTFSVYGTNDPMAYAVFRYKQLGSAAFPGNPGFVPTLPASSWVLLPAPSDQTGTGPVANPLTDASPMMQYSGTLTGIRVVLTTKTSAAGLAQVVIEAAP